jgi:hypothetical protein
VESQGEWPSKLKTIPERRRPSVSCWRGGVVFQFHEGFNFLAISD